jgi:hypothetical protein
MKKILIAVGVAIVLTATWLYNYMDNIIREFFFR